MLYKSAMGVHNETKNGIKHASDESAKKFNDLLTNASEIKAKKKLISWGDYWTIYADNKEIGHVQGRPLYMVGDAYILFNNNGQMIAAEDENWNSSLQDNSSTFFDNNKSNVGSLRQQFSLLTYSFEIYKNNDLIGKAKQNFNLKLNVNITNNSNKTEWYMSQDVFALSQTVRIKRKNQKDISGLDALRTSLIISEMSKADNEQNNNNSQNNN